MAESEDKRWYVVTACSPPRGRGYHHIHSGAYVLAESPEEAAVEGMRVIENEEQDLDPNYLDTVFATELGEQVTFNRVPGVERAELQCCGGNAYTESGHSGGCPERPDEEEDGDGS